MKNPQQTFNIKKKKIIIMISHLKDIKKIIRRKENGLKKIEEKLSFFFYFNLMES